MSWMFCPACGQSFENVKGSPPCGHDQSGSQIIDCASLFPRVTGGLAIVKMNEEVGEVADAQIGISGVNERKGVYKTAGDLRMELLDVALTALIAYVKNGGGGDPLGMLEAHACGRAERHRAHVGA